MEEGKHMKKKYRIIEVYSVLILIAALFMSVGYAEISDILLNITGTVQATSQQGVFIADVKYVENNNANTENSKINYYIGTILDSEIELGDTEDSSITYQVTIYNNSNKDYVFIGVMTDDLEENLYSNENIEFYLEEEKIKQYSTIITPTESLQFTITFKYKDGISITDKTLKSKLNFRFKEAPKLVLSNEGQKYTLNDIYPDYTPQEYSFTVSNFYSDTEINAVPMTYSFTTTIDSPLTAKIYDESGQVVTQDITIGGDGTTESKATHTYTLKIIWDNTKSTEYNNPEHAGKEFNCNVTLTATPNGEDKGKYVNYKIEKQFNVNGKTATFNFNANPTNASLTIINDAATLAMTMNNYSTDTDYNKFITAYEVSIQGNSDFTFSINDVSPTNSVIAGTLNGGSKTGDSLSVKLMADMANLDVTETLTLKIVSKSPYVTEIEIPITIKLHTVTVTLNANGGTVSPSTLTVYQDKKYTGLPDPTWAGHTFNGWFTAKTGGTQITTDTKVTTTSSTQKLYAQWTSHLLADHVSVGDKVNYEVYYTNVATANAGTTHTATDDYTGWKVLGIEGSGDDKYVKLISEGVPLSYVHSTSSGGAASVTNLTTKFLDIDIKSTSTVQTFRLCGFKTDSSLKTSVTTKAKLKSLFKNEYTQQVDDVPQVRTLTKTELDLAYYGDEDGDGEPDGTSANETPFTDNNLIAIKSDDGYATYYVATACDINTKYLWCVYWQGVMVYTNNERGIRPVVLLNPTVLTTGQDSNDVWQITN